MKFIKAFYITSFSSFIVTLFALFSNIIVTRYIGPEGRGNYSIVSNLIIVLTLVLGEGIRRSNVIVIGNKTKSIKDSFLRNLNYFLTATLIVLPPVFLFPNYLVSVFKIDQQYIFIGVIASLLGILWKGLQAINLGIQDYKSYNIAALIYTVGLFFIHLIIIYVFNLGLLAILNSFIIISFMVIIYELLIVNRHFNVSFEKTDQKDDKYLILKATVSAIAVFVMIKGDLFYLNYYSDLSTTGIYSITKIFIDIFQKLPFVLGPIIIARSASLDVNKELYNVARLSRVLISFNFFLVILNYIFGGMIIELLFSAQFNESFQYLIYILPAMIFYSSGHIINAFLMGQGFPKIVVINSCLFSIINFSLNIYFIPNFGVKLTPIITSTTFLLWAAVFIVYFSRVYKVKLLDLMLLNKNDISYVIKLVK